MASRDPHDPRDAGAGVPNDDLEQEHEHEHHHHHLEHGGEDAVEDAVEDAEVIETSQDAAQASAEDQGAGGDAQGVDPETNDAGEDGKLEVDGVTGAGMQGDDDEDPHQHPDHHLEHHEHGHLNADNADADQEDLTGQDHQLQHQDQAQTDQDGETQQEGQQQDHRQSQEAPNVVSGDHIPAPPPPLPAGVHSIHALSHMAMPQPDPPGTIPPDFGLPTTSDPRAVVAPPASFAANNSGLPVPALVNPYAIRHTDANGQFPVTLHVLDAQTGTSTEIPDLHGHIIKFISVNSVLVFLDAPTRLRIERVITEINLRTREDPTSKAKGREGQRELVYTIGDIHVRLILYSKLNRSKKDQQRQWRERWVEVVKNLTHEARSGNESKVIREFHDWLDYCRNFLQENKSKSLSIQNLAPTPQKRKRDALKADEEDGTVEAFKVMRNALGQYIVRAVDGQNDSNVRLSVLSFVDQHNKDALIFRTDSGP
ncbi:Hypothetical Protein FCC1311_058932 [Hondaea fermentalgiana]|uniref:Uncharacterized protein n=1 Tax=Hondaea fermentalgiana TaxID=2315210 RepID=A0A2R5GFI0_9STRA|nr:Hypothetical Protein FCC1311_058932 [Hondaea fermentalgiana]|eukprot:GBG29672.1 Hypothetical Protein FCC1311_058932 [Hondaea fermentalgiana]